MSLAVVCVCNNPYHPGFALLARSLERHGYAFRPVVRDWLGFHTKPAGVRDSLPSLKAEGFRHVCAVDAYDVLALGPPSELGPYLTAGCLFGTEIAPWPPVPDANLKDKYPQHPEPAPLWRYVNSGGYLGEIDFLGDYVLAGEFPLGVEWTSDDPQHLCHAWDDQLYMASRYLSCPKRDTPEGCHLDVGCNVFQTTAHTNAPWNPRANTFEVGDSRVYNRKTGSVPVFMHGNGRDDMAWIPGGAA
jgi:hypothetical protein